MPHQNMPKCTETPSGGGHDGGAAHDLLVSPALAAVQISGVEVEPAASLGSRGRRGSAPDPLALGPDVRGGPRGIAALQIYTVRDFPADWTMP